MQNVFFFVLSYHIFHLERLQLSAPKTLKKNFYYYFMIMLIMGFLEYIKGMFKKICFFVLGLSMILLSFVLMLVVNALFVSGYLAIVAIVSNIVLLAMIFEGITICFHARDRPIINE